MSARHEALVIGAGQSGLATAFYLLRAGVDTVVVDDQPRPGGAWRHVWPSMRLFSTPSFSNLPGTPMPAHPDYPPASHVIDYLAAYEERYRIPVERPWRVEAVAPQAQGFVVSARHTQTGEMHSWQATSVIGATGTWSSPFIPYYPGHFCERQWHSATYPGPQEFAGARVAVVGGGNSGAQITAELTLDERVGPVTWYTARPPRWMPDDVDGRALFYRNRKRAEAILRGQSDPGADSNLGDIVVLPQIAQARDSGWLKAQPMFGSLDEVRADHLIWCTGFRPALGPLRPFVCEGKPQLAGLELVGYGDWTGPGSATIAGVGLNAKAAARSAAARVGKQVR